MKAQPLIQIPTVSPGQFKINLSKRPYEDLDLLRYVEAFLKKKRGYVTKLPLKNKPVILLASGGLDSTITWEILLAKYRYQVYPLYLKKEQQKSNQEIKAVNYFSKYFQQKYPKLSKPVTHFSTLLLPKQIEKLIKTPQLVHPKQLLEMIDKPQSNPLSRSVLPQLNVYYALLFYQFIQLTKKIEVNVVFSGVTAEDGVQVPSQTLTNLRLNMLNACHLTQNYQLQYLSLSLDNHLKYWLTKQQLLELGIQFNLPFEKTFSCYRGKRKHCGFCQTCLHRKSAFDKTSVSDPTSYSYNQLPSFV